MVQLTVHDYEDNGDWYTCTDESGAVHLVDLVVDGGIRDFFISNHRRALIGRTVVCRRLDRYNEHALGKLASGVSFESFGDDGAETAVEAPKQGNPQ